MPLASNEMTDPATDGTTFSFLGFSVLQRQIERREGQ